MEAGGDTAAPVPGDAEDLEEMRFPSEEAEDGEGVHKDLPDPGDASFEKAGIHSLHEGLGIPRGYYSWGRFLGTQRGVFGTQGSSLNHTLGQWEVIVDSSCSLNH